MHEASPPLMHYPFVTAKIAVCPVFSPFFAKKLKNPRTKVLFERWRRIVPHPDKFVNGYVTISFTWI
jgi:hypothetical protein